MSNPQDGRMPWPVKCQVCGVDGTVEANRILAEVSAPPLVLASRIPPHAEPAPAEATPPTNGSGNGSGNGSRDEWWANRPQVTAEEARSGTYASNPGRLRPDWARVLATHPAIWSMTLLMVVLGVLGGWLLHPVLYLLLPSAAVFTLWSDYREITAILLNGDVCPGIVISEHPWRVAVLTNLSATNQCQPAVRILDQPLAKMAGDPARTGMRVATVSFYYGPITEGAWTMFKPEVVSTFVSDPAEIQRVLASISDEEWCALEEHLGRIPSKRPGLYKMWPPHNGQLTPMPRELKVAFIAIGILVLIVGASIATAIKLGRNSSTSGTASPTPLGGPARGTPQTAPPFNRSFPAAGPRNAGRPAQSEFGRIAVGDKVEVLDMRTGRWSPATTAELDGFRFRVRYDEGSRAEEWVPRGQLRPRR